MKKRILTILLSLAMIVSLMPMTAYADEEEPTPVPTENTVEEYPVWVGGVQVTSENKGDITAAINKVTPNAASGTATYDHTTNTLMLDNFNYTGEGYLYDDWADMYAVIFSENDLTIKIIENNTITASVATGAGNAICSWGAITITDDTAENKTDNVLNLKGDEGLGLSADTLTIKNITVNTTGIAGLDAFEGLSIENAIVKAKAMGENECAIYCEKEVRIKDASVTAEAPSGYGVFVYNSYENLDITDSNLIINAKIYGIDISSGDVNIENSSVEISTEDGYAILSREGSGNISKAPSFTEGKENYIVYAGDDAENTTEADASEASTYEKKYVKIEPLIKYPVWVGGEQFTSENATSGISGDDGDPSTDDGTATLTVGGTAEAPVYTVTLDNFKYIDDGAKIIVDKWNYAHYAAVSAKDADLNVVLIGNNEISCIAGGSYCYGFGLYTSNGVLTITSEDKTNNMLKVDGGTCGILSSYVGEDEYGIVIKNANVTASAYHVGGIITGAPEQDKGIGIYIENSVITSDEICPFYGGNLEVKNSTLTTDYMYGSVLTIDTSKVTCKYIGSEAGNTAITDSTIDCTGQIYAVKQEDGSVEYTPQTIAITDSDVVVETKVGKEGFYGFVTISGDSAITVAGEASAFIAAPTLIGEFKLAAGDTASVSPVTSLAEHYNKPYVKIEPKPVPTYTAPSAVSGLVYNGSNQTLITAGSATNGTMQYALGVNGTTAPTEGWAATVPTAKDAGTYYVWYKVVGDQGYADIAPIFAAAVTIGSPAPEPTPTPYIPSVTIQKPVITTDAGSDAGLSILGNTATITVAEGYELVDVTVNGVSKGAVTTLSGLKTGDTVVVTTKPIEPAKTEAELIQEEIDGMKLVARSKRITAPSGKKSIMIYWYDKSGAEVEFDGVEIFRSTDMNSGFEKVFVSKTDQYYNTAIETGTKYYYKVRGYVEVDGKKIYTDWSLKAIRAAK